ncbi:MAG: lytic murein transglycosylase B [Sterolibacterium sp.]|jgi:membrane-bound lytic murein transglycosylase B
MKCWPPILLLLFSTTAAAALPAGSFAARPEVRVFIAEMQEKHGFRAGNLLQVFSHIKPLPAVIQAILPPRDPGVRSWQTYRTRFVERKRIALGLKFWGQHEAALAAAREQTGVPEEIIASIIGIETIFGHHTGNFGALAALATLAFDYPRVGPRGEPLPAVLRRALFRSELEQLLLLARETHRDPLWYKGSFAGALGLPQFLPSSVRRYAVDGDQDGQIDLATNPTDAIASVANFLKEHGWVKDGPVAVAASAEGEKFAVLIDEGIVPRHTPTEMAAYGVISSEAPDLPAALIDLATPQQPVEYRLGYRNFYVLTRYNRSSFYAMAVLDLARELRAGR